jgi:hypothetical protein
MVCVGRYLRCSVPTRNAILQHVPDEAAVICSSDIGQFKFRDEKGPENISVGSARVSFFFFLNMASDGEGEEDFNGLSAERVALNLSLHIAAADGNYAECEKLLKEEGADAWWEDENTLNWSALHFAANGGFTKLVKLLLRCGALWSTGKQGRLLKDGSIGCIVTHTFSSLCSRRAWHDSS